MAFILIPYYSATGCVERLVPHIAKGVELTGLEARVRKIKPLRDDSDGLFVTKADLMECSGMILGSPTRFGQMAACVRSFWDETSDVWYSGSLVDKPGAVFTSSVSLHGGQESTLLGMMMPMIHHGMLIVGMPYTDQHLDKTKSGGGPYGASHVANQEGLSTEEREIAKALGVRVATIALNQEK